MEDIDINTLIEDKEKFDAFVYTPIDEAIKELEKRSKDEGLKKKILKFLDNDIPEPMRTTPRGVLWISTATPNYETRRFLDIMDLLGKVKPLFMECLDDKFVAKNKWKHSLGKLKFYNGRGKKGGSKIDKLTVVDFSKSEGKKISEVKTLWDQTLVNFHHEFFKETYRPLHDELFYDSSPWLLKHGPKPIMYYQKLLTLFVANGIFFENYMFNKEESEFTKNIFLPAFLEVTKKIGKPLIVPLELTEIEGDEFWVSHPGQSREFVNKKLK